MKRGCLIALVVAVLVGLYVWRQIGEPSRRATQVYQRIHSGMTYQDVENLLTGRYFCFYEVLVDNAWRKVSKEEFTNVKELKGASTPVQRRLNLIFMGSAPGRISFFVKIDTDGKVSETTTPQGWD